MKKIKSVTSLLMSLCVLGTSMISCGSETASEEMAIDIYIISGQSNGAGYTVYNSEVLSGLWDKYDIGTPSVLYSGVAEYTIFSPEVGTGYNEFNEWVPARAGMGSSPQNMGAEVGMAAYLSEHRYNEESGLVAGIIKSAHGGTSLLNNQGGENSVNGNWVSPSYALELGIEYSGITGGQYRLLLERFEERINSLRDLGYTDINVKGLFWMQGESDHGNPGEYEKAFAYFVSDIRNDLGRIMNEDLSSLAIIIGEISETFGSTDANMIATNMAFIAKQREIAEKMDNVYTIPSSQYKVNWIENGKSVNGQDPWHWTTADMFEIGQLVGKCIVENIVE